MNTGSQASEGSGQNAEENGQDNLPNHQLRKISLFNFFSKKEFLVEFMEI